MNIFSMPIDATVSSPVMGNGVADYEVDQHEAELSAIAVDIAEQSAQLEVAHGRMELALQTYDYLEGYKHEGADAVRNARALLMAALQGVEAHENIAALEADSSGSVANEVFKSARENIKKFIAWIVRKFQAMVKTVKDFFLKFMGTVERIQKDATKKAEKLAEMGTYTLKEKADKVDISGYVGPLLRKSKPVKDVAGVIEGLKEYSGLISSFDKNVFGKDCVTAIKDLSKAVKALKSEEFNGEHLPSAITCGNVVMGRIDRVAKENKLTPVTGDIRFGKQRVRSFAKGLLGNANFFIAMAATDADDEAKISLGQVRLMHWDQTQTKQKVAKADLPTAPVSELSSVVDTCQENLSALYNLIRGGEREAFISEVEGLYESIKNIEKAVGGDNYTSDVRSSISKIESLGNRLSELCQTTVLSISATDRSVVTAALRYVGAAMSNYEKPSEA